ncbi:hypothetical protein [Sulfitobacter sp. SK012]|uniref:hypothetical protein n=1 Tax=Sulfitobacter sp. SK012 TaxID=1389005 RepID=UPI0013B3DDEF|nr:hypothetical protein [Sulfitobacter sp. SK012]
MQSLWFAATQVGGTVLIFLLSITRGTGRCLQGGDCWVLVLAGIGLALWSITENAGYALAITIAISLIGGSVTVTKALRDPSSETMATWVCSLLAAVLAMLSVGRVDWVLLAYPFYLFALSGAIVVAMIRGRERQLQVGYPTLQ